MTASTQQQKKLLYEVSIIRPLVIFLLVLLHSFSKIEDVQIAGGGDYQLVSVYQWIKFMIAGFRIETIALVAGYVFSYQSHNLGRKYKFWPFVWKKFNRLMVPMIVFGLVYFFCFDFDATSFTISDFLLSLFSGCGHLWFLPMLFWCFIAIWIVDYFNLSSLWMLFLLAIVSIIPTPALPLGLARLPHFVFYVYGGYFLWTKRDKLFDHCLTWQWITILWILYVVLVIFDHTMLPKASTTMPFVEKFLIIFENNAIGFVMAVCGIMALFLTVCIITTKEMYKPKQWIIAASDNCYGVYVYHQFILMWLYYHTPLVVVCPPLIAPWLGFIATMIISLILTRLTLLTKIGRKLIG